MSKQYNWVVVGCGVIANELAQAMQNAGRTLYGVTNRTRQKAVDYMEKYKVQKLYENYDEVLNDKSVDVIYITTPHNTHISYILKALENGKHVLCEKSITLNSDELEKAVALSEKNGLVFAEAMTLYHMPLYKKLDCIVNGGELGAVNIITMNFGSYKEYNMENRFFNRNLAGGAMLDIGVYALSFVRFFFESKPNSVKSMVKLAPTGVDESETVILMNEQQQMATIALTLHSKQPKRAMISCDKGYVEVMEYPRGMKATITYTDSGKREVIDAGETANALGYEIADMETAISGDKSIMHLDYSRDVMEIMTSVRKECKLTYPEEE